MDVSRTNCTRRGVKIFGRCLIPGICGGDRLSPGVTYGPSICQQTRRERNTRCLLDRKHLGRLRRHSYHKYFTRLRSGPSGIHFHKQEEIQKTASLPLRPHLLAPRGDATKRSLSRCERCIWCRHSANRFDLVKSFAKYPPVDSTTTTRHLNVVP